MESCRRTGLSGVLCSLSLLCVILDIQLDGKSRFTLGEITAFVFYSSSSGFVDDHQVFAVMCSVAVIKSFHFRFDVLPDRAVAL